MRFLFFFFLLAYLLENFALVFYHRPKKTGRVIFLMFLGVWWDVFITIKAALKLN